LLTCHLKTVLLKSFGAKLCILYSDSVDKVEQTIKGVAMVQKRALDVMSCEVDRLLVLSPTSIIPLSYCVPRKVRSLGLIWRLLQSVFISGHVTSFSNLAELLKMSSVQCHDRESVYVEMVEDICFKS
jgi:hypothetical protein